MSVIDPTLSIIFSCRDKWPLLKDAVESVFAQTFTDWELIICDDDSRDVRVQAYLRDIGRKPRVRVFAGRVVTPDYRNTHKMNAVRINAGLALARGRYITYLCDDDVWYPHRCEQMVKILNKEKKIGLVIDLVEWMHPDGTLAPQDSVRFNYQQPYADGHLELLEAIAPSSFICHDCAMHRKPRECQRWATDLKRPPVDWRYWLMLHNDGVKIKKLDTVGARAIFPGTWRSGVKVKDILTVKQELPRSDEMVNMKKMKAKRQKEEKQARRKKAKSVQKYAINTSGVKQQGTDMRDNKGWAHKPGARVEAEEVAVLNPDGTIRKLLPGWSWDTKLNAEPVSEIMKKKPAHAKKYDFEKVERSRTARAKLGPGGVSTVPPPKAPVIPSETGEAKAPFEEEEVAPATDERVCAHEGCEVVLSRRNKSGYCREHYRLHR